MATWGSLLFLDAISPTMEQIIFFHDHVMIVMSAITIMVGGQMLTMLMMNIKNFYMTSGDSMEMIWILAPAVVVISLVYPSLRLLYMSESYKVDPHSTVKVIGHQWYWSYEYGIFKSLQFDSYMIATDQLNDNEFRLLDVDNRLALPISERIRMIITSSDVLHSWAVPSLGVKIDAAPGRLNQVMMMIYQSGLYYGQCSEICGANHSFMPIVVQAMPEFKWLKWIFNKIIEN
uniref:Cytochrome c oxidase subunit 2 n=1 Tax=Culicoides actoni TaxID=469747 RepID=A8B0L6_9DIPT|nr:cytochrome c oxidase subunit II [Culicoides actoni]